MSQPTLRHFIVLALVTAATASAAIHWVNDDASSYAPPGTGCTVAGYATIQGAVDAASPGDTINVCPGAYTENITINKSDLTVISAGGASAATINAASSNYVVYITRPNVTLNGFKILPAGSADPDLGVFVAIEGHAGATIVHNTILGGRIGIALGCTSSGSTIAHNTVNGAFEAGINVDLCEAPPFPFSDNNSVHHNTACGGTFPYSIAVGGGTNNQVHHNSARWISVGAGSNNVHHNTAEAFFIAPGNRENDNIVADVCP